jgi:hypothetical protein
MPPIPKVCNQTLSIGSGTELYAARMNNNTRQKVIITGFSQKPDVIEIKIFQQSKPESYTFYGNNRENKATNFVRNKILYFQNSNYQTDINFCKP